jgi:hypothetical protein
LPRAKEKKNETVRRGHLRRTEKDSPAAAGNSTAAGLGVGEAGLEEEEAKSLRVAFSSAWSSQRSGEVPGSTGPSGGHGGSTVAATLSEADTGL